MSAFVMEQCYTTPIPEDTRSWPEWFCQNARDFRAALLAFRDGARLHAGSKPSAPELHLVERKIQYLVRAGIPRNEALMAMLTAGQFTLGCVMEEQARHNVEDHPAEHALLPIAEGVSDLPHAVDVVTANGSIAFEFGLKLLADGLQQRTRRAR